MQGEMGHVNRLIIKEKQPKIGDFFILPFFAIKNGNI